MTASVLYTVQVCDRARLTAPECHTHSLATLTQSVHFVPWLTTALDSNAEIHRDNTSTNKGNKSVFNLCDEVRSPFECRYKLDTVRDDQDGPCRGLTVKIPHHHVLSRALRALDDHVIAHALKNSKDFFKKSSHDRGRYPTSLQAAGV